MYDFHLASDGTKSHTYTLYFAVSPVWVRHCLLKVVWLLCVYNKQSYLYIYW